MTEPSITPGKDSREESSFLDTSKQLKMIKEIRAASNERIKKSAKDNRAMNIYKKSQIEMM